MSDTQASGVEPAQNRAAIDAEASTFSTLKRLWPYIWPEGRADLKRRAILALLTLVLAKLVTVLVPYAFKFATDALTGEGNLAGEVPDWLQFMVVPLALVLAYGAARMAMAGFTQLRDAIFARVGQHAVRVLANRTFEHMHRLSLRFHVARRTGGLSRVIERGTKGIEAIVRLTILSMIPTILEFALVGIVVAYQFDLVYVGILAVMIVAYLGFTVWASNRRIAIRRAMNESDNEANFKSLDALLNYETVKYFGNERLEAERFDQSMRRYEKAAIRTFTSLAGLNFGQAVIFTLGMTVCMALSARQVMAGTATIGDFVMINALLVQLYIPLNFLGTMYREIKQGLVDVESMFELLDRDPEVADPPGAVPLEIEAGEVRFEDVVFSYDGARPILKGISFAVPAGRTVAIVGPSGAGKSTISRILLRFYDIVSGRVTIDGQDISKVQQASLRAAIGMVPQDTVLFNDTVFYNIRYGRPSASREEVIEAARRAQIHDFIESLPEGYETPVGERGLKLSGGEKQRVAIARTILKAPPILMLDEATSALDTHTEKEIQSALKAVSRGRTTLVIAHRLSTVIDADEIIVLVKGQIVERGRHADLLELGGVYAGMWDRQRQAAEAEAELEVAEREDDLGGTESARQRETDAA
ncbi:ABCB family ABC transporter ATP-binding protein/permease [Lutibaculum baratangense]|uniref:Lipid A export ATP-binding/permease protein MsbA n=1 Tax=Lutibaculum baratangense AMV1 TaxID=631454 RepID=V4R9T7_9HYPH|nr:ABC transporter ATP-binding protein/permease [Lutibaculum baratangense]ESR22921.1 Lipid A export ATP-binding/permease protein MsbA [Lutibaculum baratangense AMV1]